MLTFKLYPDQVVTVKTPGGETLVIHFEQFRGTQVKVAFDGPQYFQIKRGERPSSPHYTDEDRELLKRIFGPRSTNEE